MQFDRDYALAQDAADPLKRFRNEFHFPQHEGQEAIYLTGNSLGLQPKGVERYLLEELADWAKYGVEGHFEARRPWVDYHEFFATSLSKIVGCQETEVVAMGSLTANLHFLMATFYRPAGKRNKILCEQKAFPSMPMHCTLRHNYMGSSPMRSSYKLAQEQVSISFAIRTYSAQSRSMEMSWP